MEKKIALIAVAIVAIVIIGVVAVTLPGGEDDDNLVDNRELVLRTLKAHIVATEWIIETAANPESDNYTALLEMGAEFSSRSTDIVESSLNHIQFNYNITEEFLDWMGIITQKYIDLDLVQNSSITSGGYSGIDDFVSKFFNTDMVAEALDIEPSDVVLNPNHPVRLGYLVGDLHQFARVVATNDTLWGEGKNLFETYGVLTVTSEGGPYANGGAVMDAFAAGLVDVGYLGSPPAILKHLNAGTNIGVISQVNAVGSAIFVKDSITTLDDFNGKTIATPGPSSIQHLMFLDYFTSNGFTVRAAGGSGAEGKVVYWTAIAPNLQKDALLTGTIDGAITWEPFASDAVLSGAGIIYKWSDDIWPNHPCCVIAVDMNYLEA